MRLVAFQPDLAHNLGGMIRLCVAFSTPLDVIEPCGFPFSLKSLKISALDYMEHCDLTRHVDWDHYIEVRRPGRLIALTTRATTALWDFKFQPDDCLLMGRESAGLPESVHRICDAHLLIPISPQARSFNLATAAGMALYEARRQQTRPS